MKRAKILFLVCLFSLFSFSLFACSNDKEEYTYTFYNYSKAYCTENSIEPINSLIVKDEKIVTAPTVENDLYTFDCWVDGGGNVFDISAKANSNQVLYARYKEVSITPDLLGGTLSSASLKVIPYETNKLETANRGDSLFGGWYKGSEQVCNASGDILNIKEFYNSNFTSLSASFTIYFNLEFESSAHESYKLVSLTEEGKKDPNIIIPSKYNNLPVIYIADSAFKDNEKLTNITIPDSIKYIGEAAFYNCSKLTEVVIPDSVYWMQRAAFQHCVELTSVKLGNGINAILTNAFNNCSKLTSIVIPDSVEILQDNVFKECSSLSSVIIGNSVQTIERSVFEKCIALESIVIPYDVTSIEPYAFAACTALTSVTIPHTVTNIGDGAFSDCSSLSGIAIPNSVTTIGGSVFQNCPKLEINCEALSKPDTWQDDWNCDCLFKWGYDLSNTTLVEGIIYTLADDKVSVTSAESTIVNAVIKDKVTIKGKEYSVTKIGDAAFKYCSALKSLKIADSITSIGSLAFSNCRNLQSLSIGKNVQYVGKTIIYNSFETKIYCDAPSKPDGWAINWLMVGRVYWGIDSSKQTVVDNIRYTIIDGKVCATNMEDNEVVSVVIQDKVTINSKEYAVTSIGNMAFSGCPLTSISIPNSVTDIGENAFVSCAFTSLSIPNGVTNIGMFAFAGCEALTSLTIGNSVLKISEYAFANCEALTSLTIGNSVLKISEYAFARCTALTSIVIPDSVTSIGSNAFEDCRNLKNITIGKGVTSIGDYAFVNLIWLKEITIPKNVISIGNGIFSSCANLKTIYIEGTAIPSGWNEYWISESFKNIIFI